ncbi:Flagellar motor rotation protein MotB [hydrothermal vent metagenome]|uniref:Flagellar motor rotation protein MotB n=1 Tax=hydrothermal vent metagenome TaxID=652676 RepID=A0A3B1CXN7_9ZZZZ
MRTKISIFSSGILAFFIIFTLGGCTFVFQKGRRVDVEKISRLKRELTDLERAKLELEDRLRQEIADDEVKVEQVDKGLVITFVAEVLFDSGKADLRESSFSKLDKVAGVLNTTVKDFKVGVEGHSDNDPIKHSGWKSNWELSTGRALSVLHYMEEIHQVAPQRLSATGYGEHRPVTTNDTKAGKQKNRRVEIVILPKVDKKGRK